MLTHIHTQMYIQGLYTLSAISGCLEVWPLYLWIWPVSEERLQERCGCALYPSSFARSYGVWCFLTGTVFGCLYIHSSSCSLILLKWKAGKKKEFWEVGRFRLYRNTPQYGAVGDKNFILYTLKLMKWLWMPLANIRSHCFKCKPFFNIRKK